jgi:hypothetical protein
MPSLNGQIISYSGTAPRTLYISVIICVRSMSCPFIFLFKWQWSQNKTKCHRATFDQNSHQWLPRPHHYFPNIHINSPNVPIHLHQNVINTYILNLCNVHWMCSIKPDISEHYFGPGQNKGNCGVIPMACILCSFGWNSLYEKLQ